MDEIIEKMLWENYHQSINEPSSQVWRTVPLELDQVLSEVYGSLYKQSLAFPLFAKPSGLIFHNCKLDFILYHLTLIRHRPVAERKEVIEYYKDAKFLRGWEPFIAPFLESETIEQQLIKKFLPGIEIRNNC